jgi:hypothetical protein
VEPGTLGHLLGTSGSLSAFGVFVALPASLRARGGHDDGGALALRLLIPRTASRAKREEIAVRHAHADRPLEAAPRRVLPLAPAADRR